MRGPQWTAIAVWRLEGGDTVELPVEAAAARILYPTGLGIEISAVAKKLVIRFPRPKMACILTF